MVKRRRWGAGYCVDLPPREWNSCKQRWTKINKEVQKFCGCFDQASRQATSGQSDDDVYQMAYKFYNQDMKTNFILEHAWRALRNDQKWCSLYRDKGKTQTKRSQPAGSVDGGVMEEQVEEDQLDLLEVYNSEKRRLDLLKLKHNHVQKAFMVSYKRFRALHRHTIQLREDMAACERELMDAEQGSLDCGDASRESDREMAECIEHLKDTSAKMGEKWEVVKESLLLE
ncbi:unnamed protein product [Microthlaspi erraticum]|uniref:No apical meristem-associated C-terminal domain-containing protein n=1 Tax=Microthlaspi erraticum TaxID=1685480 RepID=A0A6D2KEV7_9BRAS|nr:unnamed protein product [Microthlaspi erraticum]